MSVSRTGSSRHRHGVPFMSYELLIVLAVVLILLLIAAPSYRAFTSRAHSTAARANVREAVPAIEAYFLLANNSYVGLDLQWLEAFDPGLELDDPGATPAKQTATSYCVSSTVGGKTWYKGGPDSPIATSAC
jgi:type II secretory pathway pseudopilin PulG